MTGHTEVRRAPAKEAHARVARAPAYPAAVIASPRRRWLRRSPAVMGLDTGPYQGTQKGSGSAKPQAKHQPGASRGGAVFVGAVCDHAPDPYGGADEEPRDRPGRRPIAAGPHFQAMYRCPGHGEVVLRPVWIDVDRDGICR